ncbi:sulfotransferase family [Fragilaria crotonensis]|nr:sulfotransferase family [Fragilaria crotonensis]
MTRVQRLTSRKLADSHYDLQIKFLMDASHCPVVDFVGRLERFQDDMQIIINQIQSPDLHAFFTASGGNLVDNCTNFGERKKQSELGGNLQNAYLSKATVDAVAKEFEFDFELLGYDPQQIP